MIDARGLLQKRKAKSNVRLTSVECEESALELPELTVLSKQMEKEIAGKQIFKVEVSNPKCLNMPLRRFQRVLVGKCVRSIENRGKWLLVTLGLKQVLLFNPGMGADVIYFRQGDELPEKYQIKMTFQDGTGFTIRVWWFCYLHLVPEGRVGEHKLVGKLGLSPLDEKFTLDYFKELLGRKSGNIKDFLLNQRNMAGIGNVYVQDPLFEARIHPKRKIGSLTEKEIEALYRSLQSVLKQSIKLGGLAYEKDFYGKHGNYGKNQYKIAYKSGQPCPVCQTTIEKIKTGSTSTFICPKCQRLDS
jgi:formamidopyrimidine-DNA glycosylase